MFKVIIDSCGELPEELARDGRFVRVPLTLSVDGWEILDDDSFDQAEFLRRVAASPNVAKSACPSPDAFRKEIENTDAEHVYLVTLSGKLSGSYNSALLASNLYKEDNGKSPHCKKVYVFDSRSASIGQTLIAMKVAQLEEQGVAFEEVVRQTEAYIDGQHTFFVLETLDALRKNGRLSAMKMMIANVLSIKPVMGSTDDGNICQLGTGRGMKKSLDKMVECMMAVTQDVGNKILAISHCNARKSAEYVVSKVKEAANFKDIFVLDTAGVSSLYAGDGGIIMVV